MDDLKIVWDDRKNALNVKKHGVSFEDAKTVFYDQNALLINDPEHSDTEDRFLLLGYSGKGNALIVSHCYKENDTIIRIISARKAGRTEQQQYLERL